MGVYNNNSGVLSPIAGRGNIDGVYRANGILGAKNLLPNNAKNQTINGVTFTINDDGSVTVNGTATANITTYFIDTAISLKAGKYLISGTPNSIFVKDSIGIRISNNDYSINVYGDEDGTLFTLDNDTSGLRVDIRIESGTTVSSLTFYPMIRLASDTDSTYQPYAMTNKELTKNLTPQYISLKDNYDSALINTTDSNVYALVYKTGRMVQLTGAIKFKTIPSEISNDILTGIPNAEAFYAPITKGTGEPVGMVYQRGRTNLRCNLDLTKIDTTSTYYYHVFYVSP